MGLKELDHLSTLRVPHLISKWRQLLKEVVNHDLAWKHSGPSLRCGCVQNEPIVHWSPIAPLQMWNWVVTCANAQLQRWPQDCTRSVFLLCFLTSASFLNRSSGVLSPTTAEHEMIVSSLRYLIRKFAPFGVTPEHLSVNLRGALRGGGRTFPLRRAWLFLSKIAGFVWSDLSGMLEISTDTIEVPDIYCLLNPAAQTNRDVYLWSILPSFLDKQVSDFNNMLF